MNNLYIKYSDVIPIEKNRELTRGEKKIYDLGFFDCSEKAEAYAEQKVREFAEWLLVNHTLDCIECNSGDKSIGCKECANEYIAEWQKEVENERN